jgi:hypothetical protein
LFSFVHLIFPIHFLDPFFFLAASLLLFLGAAGLPTFSTTFFGGWMNLS